MASQIDPVTLEQIKSDVRLGVAQRLLDIFFVFMCQGEFTGLNLMSTGHRVVLTSRSGVELELPQIGATVQMAMVEILKTSLDVAGHVVGTINRKITVKFGGLLCPFLVQIDQTLNGESVWVRPLRQV